MTGHQANRVPPSAEAAIPAPPAPLAPLPGDSGQWWWVRAAPGAPAFNMALDEALLAAAPQHGRPVLRFYGWSQPAATFGYSQRYDHVATLTPLRPLLRRPTGGGLVPHDGDWTYTLVFPREHPWYDLRARDSYERLHAWLHRTFRRLGLATELAAAPRHGAGACFAGAEVNDVLWRDAKIAGAAQRRTKSGLLIQGSVQPPTGALDRTVWEGAVLAVAAQDWGLRWELWRLPAGVTAEAARLVRDKYGRPDYHRQR